jgi:hypothetical protein
LFFLSDNEKSAQSLPAKTSDDELLVYTFSCVYTEISLEIIFKLPFKVFYKNFMFEDQLRYGPGVTDRKNVFNYENQYGFDNYKQATHMFAEYLDSKTGLPQNDFQVNLVDS